MNNQHIIKTLSKNADVFRHLLSASTEEQFRWRSDPDTWCLLEVICHLYDEEREDFRARIRSVLDDPTKALPPFNPLALVTSRKYMDQNFDEKLNGFITERQASVLWLESLNNANWGNAYQHERFGPMSAQYFLANWLAHDFHHIRQINRIKYAYLKYTSKMSLAYAGKW